MGVVCEVQLKFTILGGVSLSFSHTKKFYFAVNFNFLQFMDLSLGV